LQEINIQKIIGYLKSINIENLYIKETNTIKLNKLYKIGFVKRNSDRVFLDSYFDNKHFEIIGESKQLDEGDFILAKVIFNPRGKIKVKFAHILESTKQSVLLYLYENELINLKTKSTKDIDGFDARKYEEFDLFLYGENTLKYIGNLEDAKVDDFISLYSYKQEFRLDTYEYELNKKEEKIDFENRVDLTKLDFCTIDPKTAKDHDDAIYYDMDDNILYVAIADVSSYVKEGSKLDKEAYKRSFSSYFPNKVYPMLPFTLSAGICSLKPNVLRHAFVCKIYFDKNYIVKKSEFIEAVIESKNNFAYEYIDELIAKNKMPESLDALLVITNKLRTKRLKNGFDFRNSEVRLLLDENEEIENFHKEENTISHHLVEECMLLANQEAAKKLSASGIFRVHEEPDIKKIDALIDRLKDFGLHIKKKANIHATIEQMQKSASNFGIEAQVDKLIIEAQQQARYSSLKANHFGLGFEHYSHFTSPIRRYSDLILHRVLKSGEIPSQIEQMCEDISNNERQIAYMVWDLEDRKYARWAKKHIGKKYKAHIADDSDEAKIELDEVMLGLRAIATNFAGQELFSKVMIEFTYSDYISKKIECKIVGTY
jgi:ribonuclease R